jgi:hypothetical protein
MENLRYFGVERRRRSIGFAFPILLKFITRNLPIPSNNFSSGIVELSPIKFQTAPRQTIWIIKANAI